MNKINIDDIIYDPINDIVVSDGKIDEFVDNLIFKHNPESEKYVGDVNWLYYENPIIGSELIILALRARVKKGEIEPFSINFKNEWMKVDNDGRIDYWPDGFCKYFDNYLLEIL